MNALLKKGGGSPPELPSLDQRKRASHHGEGNIQGIVSRGDRCSTQRSRGGEVVGDPGGERLFSPSLSAGEAGLEY